MGPWGAVVAHVFPRWALAYCVSELLRDKEGKRRTGQHLTWLLPAGTVS